jgi:hypothetical protein
MSFVVLALLLGLAHGAEQLCWPARPPPPVCTDERVASGLVDWLHEHAYWRGLVHTPSAFGELLPWGLAAARRLEQRLVPPTWSSPQPCAPILNSTLVADWTARIKRIAEPVRVAYELQLDLDQCGVFRQCFREGTECLGPTLTARATIIY